jgi:hypothetical protein
MKTIHFPFWIVLLLSFGVSGCQAPAFSPDSPLSSVPFQSRLILHQPLGIPANQVSLWYQDGRQIQKKLLDHYHPHCKFETYAMKSSTKTIEADSFIIYKVVRWDDYASQPIKLAQAQVGIGIGFGIHGSADGPSFVNVATEMFLKSDRQPDVYRLVCSQWEDPADADHVTINQIRRTLGDTFTLELPAEYQADRN